MMLNQKETLLWSKMNVHSKIEIGGVLAFGRFFFIRYFLIFTLVVGSTKTLPLKIL